MPIRQRWCEDTLKLNMLREQIKAGLQDLARKDFDQVTDADLERYLEGLTAGPGKRVR